jgi:hypothetical protein
MFAAVPLLETHGELAAKPVGIAEGLFDPGRLGVGEGVVEVGAQVLAGDLDHGAYCSRGGGGGEVLAPAITGTKRASKSRLAIFPVWLFLRLH